MVKSDVSSPWKGGNSVGVRCKQLRKTVFTCFAEVARVVALILESENSVTNMFLPKDVVRGEGEVSCA